MNKDYLNSLAQLKKTLMVVSNNPRNSLKTRNLAKEALSVTRQSIINELNEADKPEAVLDKSPNHQGR